MHVGTAVDRDGIAHRLSAFIRDNPSGSDHYAGHKIYENRDILEIDTIYAGKGYDAQDLAKALKMPMIRLHKPEWYAANAPFQRKD